ncbi:MAG: hypothetical protein WBM35_05070, partial [Candidatus Electrothrix sp.]
MRAAENKVPIEALKILLLDRSEAAVASCIPTVLFDKDGAQPESPGPLQPGERATFGWRVDVSDCDALDYRLAFAFYETKDTEGNVFDEGEGASFKDPNPEFDLSKGDNGIIYAEMLAAPQNEGKFKVRFDIVDPDGNVLKIIG